MREDAEMSFEPGQRVVCVDGKFPPDISEFYDEVPREGAIYTVRDWVAGINFHGRTEPALYLIELTNTPNMHGIEPGFSARRFRPLEELAHVNFETNHEEMRCGNSSTLG